MESIEIKINYNFFKDLFDIGWGDGRGWKSFYFKEAQKCFRKNYTRLNKWKQNPNDLKKWGHYENNNWSWTNRINTHPNCCLSFYNWAIESNPNIFYEIGNPNYHGYNARKMWEFVDQNFDLFFSESIEKKYYRELKSKCQKSWVNGNLSMIPVIIKLPFIFDNVTNIEYTFDYGDSGDMNGIDLSFKCNGVNKTVQIKSGSFINSNDEFLVSGSQNSLEYNCDYFAYVNIDSYKNSTSLIVFDNNKKLIKSNNYIIVKNDLIKHKEIQNMSIPQKLNEIAQLCFKQNIEFIMKKDENVNEIIYNSDDKTIIITFSDFENKQFEQNIDEKIKELKGDF